MVLGGLTLWGHSRISSFPMAHMWGSSIHVCIDTHGLH